jgi:hypothetical protein
MAYRASIRTIGWRQTDAVAPFGVRISERHLPTAWPRRRRRRGSGRYLDERVSIRAGSNSNHST